MARPAGRLFGCAQLHLRRGFDVRPRRPSHRRRLVPPPMPTGCGARVAGHRGERGFQPVSTGSLGFQRRGHGKGDLARSLGAAVGIGRGVRRHLGEEAASMASAAAKTVRSEERIAILGAGAMARATARMLPSGSVTVFSRRPDSVAGHHTQPWEQTLQALEDFPVWIRRSPGASNCCPKAKSLPPWPGGASLFFIDLGMPPEFDRYRNHPAIVHKGIDDIASSVHSRPRPDLEELVAKEAAAAWAHINVSDPVGRIIAPSSTTPSSRSTKRCDVLQAGCPIQPIPKQSCINSPTPWSAVSFIGRSPTWARQTTTSRPCGARRSVRSDR